MAVYRIDADLEFLQNCDNEDLDVLVTCLTRDKDGELRMAGELIAKEAYKQHNPNHKMYWQEIAAEIQTFGGNTFANIARGDQGIPYKDVLVEVCKKMKVNFSKDSPVSLIEQYLLMKVLSDSLEKMTPEQLKEVVEAAGLKTTNFAPQAVFALLQVTVQKVGFWTMNKLFLNVFNVAAKVVINRGLAFATNGAISATVARTCNFLTGPIGLAVTGLWTLNDLAGPAYRVTIPSVFQVAYMRYKLTAEAEGD